MPCSVQRDSSERPWSDNGITPVKSLSSIRSTKIKKTKKLEKKTFVYDKEVKDIDAIQFLALVKHTEPEVC